MKFPRTLALAALFALGSATQASAAQSVAPGVTTGRSIEYDWVLTPRYGVGQYDGTLRIKITPDGIVSFQVVSGGVSGNQIWLDFGLNGPVHMTGTIENGKIVGYSWLERQDFTFTATPVAVRD